MAERYKDRSNVIFSLQVEPHKTEWEELLPFYNSMVTAIREAAAPRRPLIMVPGTNWSRDTHWAVAEPVTADDGINIIYKSHPYTTDPSEFTEFFMTTHEANLPVFVGEFGVVPPSDEMNEMTQGAVNELLLLMRDNAISWAAWIFDFDGVSALLTGRDNFTPTHEYGVSVQKAMQA